MLSFRKDLEKKDLDILDLFTLSFYIFRQNFFNFFLISMICGIPIILASAYFPPSIPDPLKIQTTEDFINWFKNEVNFGFYLNVFLSWFLDIISFASISFIVEAMVYKKIRTAFWGIKKSFSIIFPLLITSIFYMIIIFFGLAFFIVPGIVFVVLFMFTNNICALRHTWGIDAIKYSSSLIKPKFFKALFILLFILFFKNVFLISFPSAPKETREGLLYYFLSMGLLYLFDAYFKTIITLFFLNRDFVANSQKVDFD